MATVPSTEGADSQLLADERDAELGAAEQALRTALGKLPDEDRAVIRMLYYEGMSIADTARGLQIEQRRLYPRIKLLLASLRKALKSERISADILESLDSS